MSDTNPHNEENQDRWKRAKARGEYLPDGKYPNIAKAELRPGCAPEAQRPSRAALSIVSVLAVIFVLFIALAQSGILGGR